MSVFGASPGNGGFLDAVSLAISRALTISISVLKIARLIASKNLFLLYESSDLFAALAAALLSAESVNPTSPVIFSADLGGRPGETHRF